MNKVLSPSLEPVFVFGSNEAKKGAMTPTNHY